MASSAQATPSQLPEVSVQSSPQENVRSLFRVYKPPESAQGDANSPELPESFFTPTTADLKAAQDTLSARTQSLVNTPLRTQAMREAEYKAKLAKWPTTTIRVRFPDRTQLEKVFPSTDKIRSVYAFVRGALREDVKPVKFVLYQTPPKREFKVSDPNVRDQTLFQLQLSPSSVLHLKFEDDSLNHVNVPAPLDPAVLEKAEDLPRLPAPVEASNPTTSPSSSTTRQAIASSGSKPNKVPKWLKLGHNK